MSQLHHFRHTFPDGQTLTLSVDLSKRPVRMAATPLDLAAKHPAEYEMWVAEVVTPALFAACDEETKAWFAEMGLKQMT